MNSGDFVYIEYVGKIKESGEIFDLTREDVAKKENMYNEEIKYGPVPIVVDADFVMPGLNDALKEMKVGEKKNFEIKPDRAFGERNSELVKLIPEARFKEQNMDATPGSFVTINKLKGRILSVDGGRVKVDFNHPLAGKTLEYEIEIISRIEDQTEKVKALIYYFTSIQKEDLEIKIMEKTAEVEFKKQFNMMKEVKEIIAKNIVKWIKPVEKVKFVDVFGGE
jgi:FKBP-type peptidyl-prolyl cis-trans isomerase 2